MWTVRTLDPSQLGSTLLPTYLGSTSTTDSPVCFTFSHRLRKCGVHLFLVNWLPTVTNSDIVDPLSLHLPLVNLPIAVHLDLRSIVALCVIPKRQLTPINFLLILLIMALTARPKLVQPLHLRVPPLHLTNLFILYRSYKTPYKFS